MTDREKLLAVMVWINPAIRGASLVEIIARELGVPPSRAVFLIRKYFPEGDEPAAADIPEPEPEPIPAPIPAQQPQSADVPRSRPWRSVRDIQVSVCRHFGLSMAELLGDCRARRLARPRQIAMALAVRRLKPRGYSLPQIGHAFNRDHTTVLYAARKFGKYTPDPVLSARMKQHRLAA